MKFAMPPDARGKKGRPPVRAEGQKSSKAKSIVDDGETRGPASALKGKLAQMLGSTGKGPPPSQKPPTRAKVPRGPGAGMLPGIAGPTPRPPRPTGQLAIGERAELGPRTKAALRGRKR
jgi:hypothetical protein